MYKLNKMNINIGIVGGGQLAMMLTESAIKLGFHNIIVLDPTPNCPASVVGAKQILGSFTDEQLILELASKVQVLTFDIESVSCDALIKAKSITNIYPDPSCLKIIKNKVTQNEYLKNLDIPIPKFYQFDEIAHNSNNNDIFVLKTKTDGYDGKGVWKITQNKINDFTKKNHLNPNNLFIEEYVAIYKELAIIGYISHKNEFVSYPIVETIQKDGICVSTICPTPLEKHIRENIHNISEKIIRSFDTKGVFAIEFFLSCNNEIFVNEISPRVHNSGHYTIEATNCSQFEQHIRSIVGLPNIPITSVKPVIMNNILGTGNKINYKTLYNYPNLHWYHKTPKDKDIFCKNRKLGHYTVDITNNNSPYPLIYIIMGSSSDYNTLKPAIDLLNEYKIPIKVDVVSAHRSPEWMFQFGKNIHSHCGKVIIAGAGGAAHLPGMVASLTKLPVIGVPIPTKYHSGMDSLLSIVEMPDGVPVATTGIGKAKNAAILALKCIYDDKILNSLIKKNKEKVCKQRTSLVNL